MRCRIILLVIFLVSMLTESGVLFAQTHGEPKIAILVSLKIRPYMDAVQGMENYLKRQGGVRWDILFVETEPAGEQLRIQIEKKNYSVLIAVGPEAMQYIWINFPGPFPHKLFSMVMEPEKIIDYVDPACGIALNLPASIQLNEIKRVFPTINHVGLIYDPANNETYAEHASTTAKDYQLDLIHLKVHSRENILRVFRSQSKVIEALWMIPDPTVISESIIPFIIKEAIASNVAVFGYNQYFIDSGAAASLVRRYTSIGRQTAVKAIDLLSDQPCSADLPDYEVVINPKVFGTIGLPVPKLNSESK